MDDERRLLDALAEHLPMSESEMSDLTLDQLYDAMRQVYRERIDSTLLLGMLAAEANRRGQDFNTIAKATGIARSTAHNWAKRFRDRST